MEIVINGKTEVISSDTIEKLLEEKGLKDIKGVIVEQNGKIIESAKWTSSIIADKDIIEILKLMGGG